MCKEGFKMDLQSQSTSTESNTSKIACLKYGEDFVVGELLGEGATGAVHKGTLQIAAGGYPAGSAVAVKVMPYDMYARAACCDVLIEMSNMRQLGVSGEHHSVVQLIGTCITERHCYLILELMQRSLSQHIEEVGALDIPTVCDWVSQIIIGLRYIQICGLVHRDVKSNNILLRPCNKDPYKTVVKIADLGSAQNNKKEEYTSLVVGTLKFMAPEVLERVGGFNGSVGGGNKTQPKGRMCATRSRELDCEDFVEIALTELIDNQEKELSQRGNQREGSSKTPSLCSHPISPQGEEMELASPKDESPPSHQTCERKRPVPLALELDSPMNEMSQISPNKEIEGMDELHTPSQMRSMSKRISAVYMRDLSFGDGSPKAQAIESFGRLPNASFAPRYTSSEDNDTTPTDGEIQAQQRTKRTSMMSPNERAKEDEEPPSAIARRRSASVSGMGQLNQIDLRDRFEAQSKTEDKQNNEDDPKSRMQARSARSSFALSAALSQPKEQYYFSEKVDVYGVGMILYQMLSGSEPFKGISGPQVFFTVLGRKNQPQIKKLQLPPLLEYILRMCLHHDPQERLTLQQLWRLWQNFKSSVTDDALNDHAASGIRFDTGKDEKILEAVQQLRELHHDYTDHSSFKRPSSAPSLMSSGPGTYDRSWEAMVPKGSVCDSTYTVSVAESIAESCEEELLQPTTSGLSSSYDEDFSISGRSLRGTRSPPSDPTTPARSLRQCDSVTEFRKSKFKLKMEKLMKAVKLFRIKAKERTTRVVDEDMGANLHASVHGYLPSAEKSKVMKVGGSAHGRAFGSHHGNRASPIADDMYTIWSSRSSPSMAHASPGQVQITPKRNGKLSLMKRMFS